MTPLEFSNTWIVRAVVLVIILGMCADACYHTVRFIDRCGFDCAPTDNWRNCTRPGCND